MTPVILITSGLALSALWLTSLQAQNPYTPMPSAPSTGWQQLEATYQNELKKIHLPLLSAHVNELTRLASVSRNAETTVAINNELREMQRIIASGGVVNLAPAIPGANPPQPSPAPPSPKAKPERVVALRPAAAQAIVPPPPNPLPPTVAVEQIKWSIDALPKGDFEVICQGAITSLETPATLTVQAGEQMLKLPLAQRHVTTDPEGLRLIRVGVIHLNEDVVGLPLILSLDTKASPPPTFLLRQILISRSKPAAPASP